QLTLRRKPDEPVEPREAGRMKRLSDADTRNFRTGALPAPRGALLPVERRGALFQRIHEKATRHGHLVGAETRVGAGRIDAADLQTVEPEFPGRLVHERLDGRDGLVVSRTALRGTRRRVRHD